MNRRQSERTLNEKTLHRIRTLSRRHVRQAEGCFYLEGIRQFVQACDTGLTFECVSYSPVLLKSPLVEKLIRRLGAAGTCRVRLTPEQFRSVSTADRASGIGAICRQRWTPLHVADPRAGICWIVVESLRNSGNLGTILRTAEACGAGGIIFVGPDCDPFDPVVVRASMGGMFHLQLVRTSTEQLAEWIQTRCIQLVGLSPDAQLLWTELPAKRPVALAIGEERSGISTELRRLCTTTVRLPMVGRADSLNVGVAAGVMMYELVRQANTI